MTLIGGSTMKYPILKAEWIPVENPEEKGITHQNFRAYILAVGETEDLQKFQLLNEALFFEKDYSPDQNSAEFPVRIPWYNPPIPPWNSNGELNLESLTVITTGCFVCSSVLAIAFFPPLSL